MSRRYDIQIAKDFAAVSPIPANNYRFSSLNDPGALDIEVDAIVAQNEAAMGGHITIFNPDASFLQQNITLNNHDINISLGMAKGLPFANAVANKYQLSIKAKILLYGQIWQGNDMRITMDLTTAYSQDTIVWNYKKGQNVGESIKVALNDASFGATISTSLVPLFPATLSENHSGVYSDLTAFKNAVMLATSSSVDANDGIAILTQLNGKISITNQSISFDLPKIIQFYEIVGQVQRNARNGITVKTIMRSDIALGDLIYFPSNKIVASTGKRSFGVSQNIFFAGQNWRVTQVQYQGRFRQAGADNWVSIFNAIPN